MVPGRRTAASGWREDFVALQNAVLVLTERSYPNRDHYLQPHFGHLGGAFPILLLNANLRILISSVS
jgi:hypothetical protein